MLQAVVSLGKNPLPAKVRIKAHATKGEEFYNVNQWKWYNDPMVAKDYEDPVEIQVRTLLNRGLVMKFLLFKFKHDPLIKKYVPELPMPHNACIREVIEIIKKCQGVCVMEIVSVQKTSLVCAVHAVGSAFIISAVSGTVVCGNVQSWGLYWGSAGSDLCVTCPVECVASSVLGLTVRGRHPSY